MKMAICHYSNSGDTEARLQFLAGNIGNAKTDLFDMKKDPAPALDDYDIVGFAAFTDFGGPSKLVQDYLEALPEQDGKPAFVFNTYGFVSARTLAMFAEWVTDAGFTVVAGHSLHTPESYPRMIAKRKGFDYEPDKKGMRIFDAFIAKLDELIGSELAEGKTPPKAKIKADLMFRLMPVFERDKARRDMGEKHVIEAVCIECGTCEKGCPYHAIVLDPKPVFDMEKCYGCWYCYNHCPKQAIYTDKFKGVGHYPEPNEQIKDKLKV